MKLASFESPDGSLRIGALIEGDRLVDLTATSSASGIADPAFADMLALIDAGEPALDRAQAMIGNPHAITWPLDAVRLLSPLPRPRQMRCFSAHASHYERVIDTGMRARYGRFIAWLNRLFKFKRVPKAFYERPYYYKANPFAVAGHGAPIIPPPGGVLIDYECELGVIIGKAGKNIDEDDAMDHVFGYTIYNDVTARGLLAIELSSPMHAGPAKGKDFDGSHILGPVIVTADEMEDPYCRKMTVRVNGIEQGQGDTDGLTHSIAEMIAYASRGETLQPGEFFGTGACEYGTGFENGAFPKPGDLIELEIEGIGTLANPMAGLMIGGS